TAFLVPFALGGLGLLFFLPRLAWRTAVLALLGRVRLEASAYPFVAGGAYTVLVEQTGRGALRDVRPAPVCCGPVRPLDTGPPQFRELVRLELPRAEHGTSMEGPASRTRATLQLAEDAPPSSAAQWSVEVRGLAGGKFPYVTEFPVVVREK